MVFNRLISAKLTTERFSSQLQIQHPPSPPAPAVLHPTLPLHTPVTKHAKETDSLQSARELVTHSKTAWNHWLDKNSGRCWNSLLVTHMALPKVTLGAEIHCAIILPLARRRQSSQHCALKCPFTVHAVPLLTTWWQCVCITWPLQKAQDSYEHFNTFTTRTLRHAQSEFKILSSLLKWFSDLFLLIFSLIILLNEQSFELQCIYRIFKSSYSLFLSHYLVIKLQAYNH